MASVGAVSAVKSLYDFHQCNVCHHADIDECSLDPSPCNQLCFDSEGSYECKCKIGFRLDADQKTCIGTS